LGAKTTATVLMKKQQKRLVKEKTDSQPSLQN
jgi:hypothetical protein